MSTIDNPAIIAQLLRRQKYDQIPDQSLIPGNRFSTQTILEYTSGFGSKCWKLIYAMYADGSSEEEACRNFLKTANIMPGTDCKTILFQGKLTEFGKTFLQENS